MDWAVSGSGVPEDEMRPGFRVTIEEDRGDIAQVNAEFAAFAEGQALPDSVRRSLQVALDELLTNILGHGFAGRDGWDVTVEAELVAGRVHVTVTDNGGPFNPLDLDAPDTTLTPEERRIGGLGIHLVREMMDEVSYRRRADRNVVVLAKRLTPG